MLPPIDKNCPKVRVKFVHSIIYFKVKILSPSFDKTRFKITFLKRVLKPKNKFIIWDKVIGEINGVNVLQEITYPYQIEEEDIGMTVYKIRVSYICALNNKEIRVTNTGCLLQIVDRDFIMED